MQRPSLRDKCHWSLICLGLGSCFTGLSSAKFTAHARHLASATVVPISKATKYRLIQQLRATFRPEAMPTSCLNVRADVSVADTPRMPTGFSILTHADRRRIMSCASETSFARGTFFAIHAEATMNSCRGEARPLSARFSMQYWTSDTSSSAEPDFNMAE